MQTSVTDEKPAARSHAPYLVFMLVLSALSIAALAVTTFADLPPATRTILSYADNAVCLLFFIDFLLTFFRSRNRMRYLMTWGWLDLLSSIPAIDSLRWGRAARMFRIIRVLRGIRAAKILSEFLLRRRAQSAFLAALLVSLLLVVLAAAAILEFESSPDANIRDAEDAVWWAMVTITTVGYGDKFPLSAEGRIIAVLLMTAGVGLFGTFSGFVASWFLEAPAAAAQEPDTGPDSIAALVREVRELREEVRTMRSGGPH